MTFDNIFTYTGEYGRYHKLVSLSICSLIISNAFLNIATVFINGSMDHHCKPTKTANCSVPDGSDCWKANLSMSLPPDDEGTLLINETQCRMYTINDNKTELTKCEYGWTYDRSQYESTIVSEFDLVCEDSFKVSLASSLYIAGSFFGSPIFGSMSDYFGRKTTIFVAFVLKLLTGVFHGIAPSYWFFVTSRIFGGITGEGLYIATFVYVTELVGPSRRAMMATIVTLYWCLGMLLAVIAYFIRSWKTLFLVISISLTPLLLLYFFIPESARWLLVKERSEEAKRVLRRIAKGNNRGELPDEIFENLKVEKESGERKKTKTSPLDIIRYPSMRKKTINITYSWFTVNLVYYGLAYGVEGLNVDVYIGTFLSGLTEVFAYLFTWFVIQKFGRRLTLVGTLVAGGIACFVNIWIPSGIVELRTATMIGKFFITSAFAIVYVYTVEIFPTDIRTIGLGVCSFCSRVGGVLAPQILFLEKLWTPLPLVAFSFTSVSAGLLALLLPETLNVPLPQTIEEAELMTRRTDKQRSGVFHDIGLQPVKS